MNALKYNKSGVPLEHICKICNKGFVHPKSVQNHMIKCHQSSSKKSFNVVEKKINSIIKEDNSFVVDKKLETHELKIDNLDITVPSNNSNNLLKDDRLIQLLKENFNDSDNKLFKLSFDLFNKNYNNKNDFIVDLDDIYPWVGYSQKVKAKEMLVKNFIKDRDYIISLSHPVKQLLVENKIVGGGGQNKETFLLNTDTVKRFCLKANTSQSNKIYDYYIKIEEIIFRYIQEKFNEQHILIQSTILVLENKNIEIEEKFNELNAKNSEIKKLRSLLEEKKITYEEIETNQSIYVFSGDIEGTYKVGESSRDIRKRRQELQTSCVKNIVILFEFKTFNSKLLEDIIHNILERYRCNSSREYFRCNLDYIKNLITIVGTCLNLFKSTFQDISNEELINKTVDKLNKLNKSNKMST